jgi:hypothetical protein
MSGAAAPIVPQSEDDYSIRITEPVLVAIRSRLMRDRPDNIIQYISEHGHEIVSESEALAVPAVWQSESSDSR